MLMNSTSLNKGVQPEVTGLCDAWPRDSTNLKLPMAPARQTGLRQLCNAKGHLPGIRTSTQKIGKHSTCELNPCHITVIILINAFAKLNVTYLTSSAFRTLTKTSWIGISKR